MKKYLSIIAFIFVFQCPKAISQAQDSTLIRLLTINESQFVNKPLDSIIAILPAGYTGMKIFGIRNTARKLNILYPNRVWIELHVRHFSFMNEVDNNNIWDVSLMRKENLYKIAVYKSANCYAGCPDY